ncbi:MAG: hypothetical protein WC256_11960, partial [Desulfurivibrionaceae bacterium]
AISTKKKKAGHPLSSPFVPGAIDILPLMMIFGKSVKFMSRKKPKQLAHKMCYNIKSTATALSYDVAPPLTPLFSWPQENSTRCSCHHIHRNSEKRPFVNGLLIHF